MLNAALMSAFAQSALILGALLVWRFASLTRGTTVGALMAFGAGAVISAVTIDLVAVAYDEAGAGPTAMGIAVGCLGYYAIIQLLERRGQSESPGHEALEVSEAAAAAGGEVPAATRTEARNIMIGMLIDGIPESIAIGLTMHMHAAGVSFALVGSIFVASLPEAIGVAAALRAGGFTLSRVLVRLISIVVVCAIFGAVGFGVLEDAPKPLIALIQSIAAGALLVVVVNEMVPIAVRGVQRRSGLLAAAGFVFSAILTWIPGA
jgi:ZIP family zinc transporter